IHAYPDILALNLWYLRAGLPVRVSLLPDCIGDLLHMAHEPSPVRVLTVKVLTDQVHASRAVGNDHPVPISQLTNGSEFDIRINTFHRVREGVVLPDEIIGGDVTQLPVAIHPIADRPPLYIPGFGMTVGSP